MASKDLVIKGARVHNLKNIDVTIPRDKLVVFTGLSGSGKSSLAFDTVYAEGHRRFVESLSSYARMFLGQLDKPDVDLIEGLSPAISINQKTTSANPRSTVGTVTEIYDYLRLLFARVGIPHCPICGKVITPQSIDQIIDQILTLPEGTKFMVLSPVVSGKKGLHEKVFADAQRNGFARVRVDGDILSLDEEIALDKNKKHHIDIIVDRLVMKEGINTRLTDSVEHAAKMSEGHITIALVNPPEGAPAERKFSMNYACDEHGVSLGELAPRMFSFNSPFGACSECDGLGETRVLSVEKLFPDFSLSLSKGACVCNGFKTIKETNWSGSKLNVFLEPYGCTIDTPLCDMTEQARNVLFYGNPDKKHFGVSFDGIVYNAGFHGIVNEIDRRYKMSINSHEIRDYYESFMEIIPCEHCEGKRLKTEALSVTVGDKNIAEISDMPITAALEFFENLQLSEKETAIAREILKEIKVRLGFLNNVGLDYLTLSRKAGTLSGGESQRIRLATQIGSSLMGVLYILDEPSIGLHQRDNHKLIETLKKLRDLGNTLIVVEHDEETMREADYIVDIGPGAGVHGGEVVFFGTIDKLLRCKSSITADYLSGRRKIEIPRTRRAGNGNVIKVFGAYENNLKSINVEFPLGTFTCVTGVSGSGKSSLVNGVLLTVLTKTLNRSGSALGRYKEIYGIENIDKVISIDQSPIGRTPRSNPATYTGLFTDIRELFASTNDAKMRGFKKDRFSFNLKGGRCEACEGDGSLKIEMNFLPDVYVTCDICKGKRYNRETLEVKYKGKNIFDVLDMTVDEGLEFFENLPHLKRKLQTLSKVGLGYIKIGQSSTTLSGGEAQRVKLATELSKRSTGKTVYILDEPTTGLHSADVDMLISVLQRLVDAGNTVIVIEHNLDLIKSCDYIIDMGPEGGDKGGNVVTCGTPEEVAKCDASYTGQYLKSILDIK